MLDYYYLSKRSYIYAQEIYPQQIPERWNDVGVD